MTFKAKATTFAFKDGEFVSCVTSEQKAHYKAEGWDIVTDTELADRGFVSQKEVALAVKSGDVFVFDSTSDPSEFSIIVSVTPLTQEEINALSDREQEEITNAKAEMDKITIAEDGLAKLTQEEKEALGLV